MGKLVRVGFDSALATVARRIIQAVLDAKRIPAMGLTVFAVTFSLLLNACGGGDGEDLSSCTETETGYRVVDRSPDVSCPEARSVLGLLGAAEHGVQSVESDGGPWVCRVYPTKKNEIKYRCRRYGDHFNVVQT